MNFHKEKSASVGWSDAFTPGRLALFVAALLFVLYPEVVLGTHSFFYRDFGFFGYPLADYFRESFWRGEIPLWNPLSNCGLPFLAQWNTMVCYPFSIFFLLLPLPWSLNIFCLGHLVLAAVNMHLLARRWTENRFAASVAGLAYALNGLTLHALMWPNNLAALAWLPLVVLTVERAWREGGRRIVTAALVCAVQFLAGAPEILLLTWLLLGSLWLGHVLKNLGAWKNLLFRFALVSVLVFGLTAVQLLPFLDLLRHSHRGVSFDTNDWAMPKWGLANFIVPLFRCSPSALGVYSQTQQEWTSSYYLGIGVVMLAALAAWKVRRARVLWLWVAAIAGVTLAFGGNSFIYPLFKRIFPILGLARYPVKFVVLTLFALPLLAGFAVNWWLNEPDKSRARRNVIFAAVILLLLSTGVLAVANFFPDPESSFHKTFESGLSRALFLILIASGFFLLENKSGARQKKFVGFGILLLLGCDALTHAPRQNPTVASEALGVLPPVLSQVPRFGESRAMISPMMQSFLGRAMTKNPFEYYTGTRRLLYDDCNLLDDIPKVNGFFSLYLREEGQVRARLYNNPTNIPVALADFLGVSQISSDEEMFNWIPRATFMPLVTAGQKPTFPDPAQTLPLLVSANFNPRHEVFLPLEARAFITATNFADVKILSSKFSAHKLELQIETKKTALMVVAQSFYHCWRAEVDGRPARLWCANHAFQAVEIPGGKHEVRLVYRDWNFYAGAMISSATLAGCLIFQLRGRKQRVFDSTTACPPLFS